MPFYLSAFDVSVLSDWKAVAALPDSRARGAWVYYLGRRDGGAWRVRLDGSRRERLRDVGLAGGIGRDDFLFFEPDGSGGEELWVYSYGAPERMRRLEPALLVLTGDDLETGVLGAAWGLTRRVRDLSGPRSAWRVASHPGLGGGPVAFHRATGRPLYAGLETPFSHRSPRRSATHLPGDFLVTQFGPEILVLDLGRRLRLSRGPGQGPAVKLDPVARAASVRHFSRLEEKRAVDSEGATHPLVEFRSTLQGSSSAS